MIGLLYYSFCPDRYNPDFMPSKGEYEHLKKGFLLCLFKPVFNMLSSCNWLSFKEQWYVNFYALFCCCLWIVFSDEKRKMLGHCSRVMPWSFMPGCLPWHHVVPMEFKLPCLGLSPPRLGALTQVITMLLYFIYIAFILNNKQLKGKIKNREI